MRICAEDNSSNQRRRTPIYSYPSYTKARHLAGLINYTEVLVSGTGRAVKKKLGNQYFLQTMAKCKLMDKKQIDFYILIMFLVEILGLVEIP